MWSPKSKKVKRELSFDSSNKGDVTDDDSNDNKDPSDNNNDAYHSLSTKREEKQQHEEVEFIMEVVESQFLHVGKLRSWAL